MADDIKPPVVTPPPAPPVEELGAGGHPNIPTTAKNAGGAGGSWTDPTAVDRFADSATEAVTQGIHGAIGMGKEILNPPGDTEKAKIKHIAKTLILDPMAKQEMAARTSKTPWESIGHSIAEAIPMVGPWAADVAEQTGTQAGTGDWAGAAGTAAGNALVAEAISHLTPGGKEEPVKLSKETGLGPVKTPAAEAEAPVEMNRETVGKLKNLGYSNQQITNFNINEIGDILKSNTKAPPIDFSEAKGKPAEPKVEPKVAPLDFSAAKGVPVESYAQSKMVDMPAKVAQKNGYQIEHVEGRQRFASGSEAPQSVNVVSATTGGKEVGRVNYKMDGDTASIKAAAVDPAHQQQGLGREMYLRAANEAQARGATSITSDLQGTTSMDAARVWDGLIARGYPVEKIPSKPGSPGYRMDLTKPIEPAPQYWKALANRGEMPGQDYNFGPVYGETGGYVAPDVQKNTGKGYPRSPAGVQKYVDKLGTTTGTGLLPTPEHLIDTKSGETTESTNTHEYSHAFNALWDGLPVNGMEIRSHLHPKTAQSGAAAEVYTPWENLPGAHVEGTDVWFDPESFKNHAPTMLRTLIGGPIGEELFHGINAKTNRGAGGDRNAIQRLGKNLGLTAMEMNRTSRSLTDEVRGRMDDPRVQDLIHEFSQTREEGLNKAYLASPEKIQEFAKRVQSLKQEIENEKASGTYTKRSVTPRSNPVVERSTGKPAAGTTGGVSEGVSGGAGTPAKPELHPDAKAVIDKYGVSDSPGKLNQGASFIWPDGSFTHLPGIEHPTAIEAATGERTPEDKAALGEHINEDNKSQDSRIRFISDTGAIRTRFRGMEKAGATMHISVPPQGVTPEQIDSVRDAVARAGRYGNLVMERADVSPETKDKLTMTQEFPRISDVEDYLRRIEAHPDQHPKVENAAQKNVVTEEPIPARRRSGWLTTAGKILPFDHTAHTHDEIARNSGIGEGDDAERDALDNGHVRVVATKAGPVFDAGGNDEATRDLLIRHLMDNPSPNVSLSLGPQIWKHDISSDDAVEWLETGARMPVSVSNVVQKKLVPAEKPDYEKAADQFNIAHGRPPIEKATENVDPELGKKTADLYDQMQHDPNNPKVQKAFEAMKKDVDDQWNYVTKDLGVKIEPWTKEGQPYANSQAMRDDVNDNQHLYFSRVGEVGEHPFAEKDKAGLTYQDKFRSIHDFFGHVVGNNEFGPTGERRAYLNHRQMFSAEAQPAMTALTQGQNSWVNFGPHMRNQAGELLKPGEPGYIPLKDRPFAEQKVGLLPGKREFQPVDRDKYAQEVANSPHAASLSQVSETPGQIYQMTVDGDPQRVYYSINKDGDIAGVVNNSGGSIKGALNAIMPHAIEQGGDHLDAWSIKGALPKLYAKYGFEITKVEPYDADAFGEPSDALKQSWRLSGWNDKEPYPSVVHMALPKAIEKMGGVDKPNYPTEDRIKDMNGEKQSDIPKFENTPKWIYDHLTDDAKAYLKDNPGLQKRMVAEVHNEPLTTDEAISVAAASSDVNGWWRRFSDIMNRIGDAGKNKTTKKGVPWGDVFQAVHSSLSGNKPVEDANNLSWGVIHDWIKAGQPTDRPSLDAIVRNNGAVDPLSGKLGPTGEPKKGNAAMSDTLNKKGKVVHENLDTTELYRLMNSPEMKGEKSFGGKIWSEESPIEASGAASRKLPSMLATTAGGDLSNAVIDAIMGRFMGRVKPNLMPRTEAEYLADTVFLKRVGDALDRPTGEAQEQIWTTTQAFLKHLKDGLTPEEAADKIREEGTYSSSKDYADIILKDQEVVGKGGYLDRLKKEFGIGPGSAGVTELHKQTRLAEPPKAGESRPIDRSHLATTGQRIFEGLNERVKQRAAGRAASVEEQQTAFPFGANTPAEPLPAVPKPKQAKGTINAMDFLKGMSAPGKSAKKK